MTRVRIALVLALTVALVAGGGSAAWALFQATAPATFTAAVGTPAVHVDAPASVTTPDPAGGDAVTAPITVTNSGTLAGSATTTATTEDGDAAGLAQSVSVVAWPVVSPGACTADAAAGSDAVSGTWASFPELTTDLGAGEGVTWCTRSTPDASTPASSTVAVRVTATLTVGTWTATDDGSTALASASSAVPAVTCEDQGGNEVYLSWDPGSRPSDTSYGAFVGQTRVGVLGGNGYNEIPLSPSEVQPAVPAGGSTQVDIVVVDASGAATTDRVATGTITLFTQNDGPAIRCGA